MHHDPFTQLGQLALMAVTGAFAGLARVLSLYTTTFDKRRLLANVFGGAVVAIISGGLYVFAFPEKGANILIIAAISSAAGALGFPWIMAIVRGKVEDRLGLQDPDEITGRLAKSKMLEDEPEIYSMTTQKMIDSGEFTSEEIQQLLKEARRRSKKLKKQDVKDESDC